MLQCRGSTDAGEALQMYQGYPLDASTVLLPLNGRRNRSHEIGCI